MHLLRSVAHFFAGIFLVNAVPHLTHGLSGHVFQTPFASPPGVGLSSPEINACWGFANLLVAYLLLYKASSFEMRKTSHAGVVFAGMVAGGVLTAHYFGLVNSGV